MAQESCSTVGVILAGGASSRMGQPKHALILPNGRSMIGAIAMRLGEVCSEVAIVGELPASTLPPDLEGAQLKRINDLRGNTGPLGGVEAALASGLGSQYLICPCDMPLLNGDLLRALLKFSEAPITVLRLADQDEAESLPMRISAAALATIRNQLDADQRSLRSLIATLPAEVVEIPQQWERFFSNINTPQDWERLRTTAD